MDNLITITLHVTKDGIFCNANDGQGSFTLNTAQPTLDLALAGNMPFIRSYVERFQEELSTESTEGEIDALIGSATDDYVVNEYTQDEAEANADSRKEWSN